MEETDIIIYLKKKKTKTKTISKKLLRLKTSFIDVKNQLIVIKVHCKIAMAKRFFISASINSVKDNTVF